MPNVKTLSDLIDRCILFGRSGTEVSNGEILHIETNAFEKIFNCVGCTLAFSYNGGVAVTPFHCEEYLGLLREYGYSLDNGLPVPLSEENLFPVKEAKRWEALMADSRATLNTSMS